MAAAKRSQKEKPNGVLGWCGKAGIGGMFVGGFGVMQNPEFFWVSITLFYLGLALLFLDIRRELWYRKFSKWGKASSWIIALSISVLVLMFVVLVPAPLEATTVFTGARYEKGTQRNGIEWRPEFSELTLILLNPTRRAYEDLSIVIRPNAAVGAISHDGVISDVTFEESKGRQMTMYAQDKTGEKRAVPLKLLACDTGYRMRCGRLPAKSKITITMAITDIIWHPDNRIEGVWDKNYILRYASENGTCWYGHAETEMYTRQGSVGNVAINGSYIAAQRNRDIKMNVPVTAFQIPNSK